jgi:DNA-binding PadR family transcriptional regulator
MAELGKFRAIAQKDLAEFAYGGDKGRMRPDIKNLMSQGLVEMKSIPHEEMGSRKLFTLTKNGHRFLTDTQSAGKGQVLYHGFTRPREATTPISTGSIKKPGRRSSSREAETSG